MVSHSLGINWRWPRVELVCIEYGGPVAIRKGLLTNYMMGLMKSNCYVGDSRNWEVLRVGYLTKVLVGLSSGPKQIDDYSP